MPGTSSSGGRNKKSRREHALAGTGRKDRGTKKTATSVDDADPPKGRPPIPIGLIGLALEEWKRMVARLELAGTVSTVDDAALYQYCCLFAETEAILIAHRTNVKLVAKLQVAIAKLRDGDQIVQAIAQVVQLKKLEVKSTAQLRQGHMALRQYLVELGMTPAARGRVKVTETPLPDDPFAEFDGTGPKH
jgi:phage terminase small subunit